MTHEYPLSRFLIVFNQIIPSGDLTGIVVGIGPAEYTLTVLLHGRLSQLIDGIIRVLLHDPGVLYDLGQVPVVIIRVHRFHSRRSADRKFRRQQLIIAIIRVGLDLSLGVGQRRPDTVSVPVQFRPLFFLPVHIGLLPHRVNSHGTPGDEVL